MRRVAAMTALSVVVAAALFLPAQTATAATAADPHPGDLPSCASQATDDGLDASGGGWDTRQITARGSDDIAWAGEFRPRTLRLGEVCVGDGTNGVDGEISFPFQVDDSPVGGDPVYSDGEIAGGVDHNEACSLDGTKCFVFLGREDTGESCFEGVTGYAGGDNASVSFTYTGIGTSVYDGTDSGSYTVGGNLFGHCDGLGTNADHVFYYYNNPARTNLRYFVTDNPAGFALFDGSDYAGPGAIGTSVSGTAGSPMYLGGNGTTAVLVCSRVDDGEVVQDSFLVPFTYRIEQDFAPTWDPEFTDPSWVNTSTYSTAIIAVACSRIVSLSVNVGTWDEDGFATNHLLTWTGQRFITQAPYTDEPPALVMCTENPLWQGCTGGTDPDPISCSITYTDPGNPITSIGDFLVGFQPWLYCMVIPHGWDREGLVPKVVLGGALAQSAGSLSHALPSSLSCGPVAALPMLGGGTLSLTTCSLDVMNTGFKNVIGYVIVLTIAGFAVKRILWALGGDSAPLISGSGK